MALKGELTRRGRLGGGNELDVERVFDLFSLGANTT